MKADIGDTIRYPDAPVVGKAYRTLESDQSKHGQYCGAQGSHSSTFGSPYAVGPCTCGRDDLQAALDAERERATRLAEALGEIKRRAERQTLNVAIARQLAEDALEGRERTGAQA